MRSPSVERTRLALASSYDVESLMRSSYGIVGAALLPFDFNLGALAFTPGMAKRAGGTFAAAPIVQGKWEVANGNDQLTFPPGTAIFDFFYPNIDMHQGSISFWITPEWDGNDGLVRYIEAISGAALIYKTAANNLRCQLSVGAFIDVDISGWTVGTTYHVVLSWDTKKTIDGTNYFRASINNSHTFGGTTIPVADAPYSALRIGSFSTGAGIAADAIISGRRTDRRVWYEATSGTGEPYYFDASGYIDEIAAAYAAGAGADPALVGGSWDGCMCLPTDSAVGALATGTGNAWSHPHASALLNNTWLEDTFGPNQQDVVTFNGTTTSINCGSAVALDDIGDGAVFTIDGWFKSTGGTADSIIGKGNHGSGGWLVFIDGSSNLVLRVDLVTTNVSANFSITSFVGDGKWHYYRAYYDDATKTGRMSVDGEWGNTSVGLGLWQTDAANDLIIGARFDLLWEWQGDLGWQRLSDNDRGGGAAGTDFIPPRTMPGADGNTIEQWGLDDGAGAAAVATVTSPGNDGAIANGTWTEKWEYTGTPVELTSLEFDGAATKVEYGSAASLDDLPNGAIMTIDGWLRHDGGASDYFFTKGDGSNGWRIFTAGTGALRIDVELATTDALADTTTIITGDGIFHHFVCTYIDATKTVYIALDGVWEDSGVGVGAYQLDNALNLINAISWDGASGWLRISDNDRFGAAAGTNFLPPSRVNPPSDDGNIVSLWLFDEGAGTTVADTNANANDGTITMGAGQWRNTFAQETDAPGERTYAWGYSIGSDGASDGVEQHLAVSAGDDLVLRKPVRYEGATPQAQILVYDETGAAAISTFDGPPLTGVHDGGDDAAAMTDTGNFYPASLVDGIIYNITDGSSGTITAVGGTNQDTITATLSGGIGDDWDDGDVYMIVPPDNWVWCEPFCVEMPAGCTEASVQLLNAAGDGVLHWQQAEVQTSLVPTGSMETGAGNPYIPTGWTNNDLDAGDTVTEAVIVHSGAASIQFNVGAINTENLQYDADVGADRFAAIGAWAYADGLITGGANTRYVFQASLATLFTRSQSVVNNWEHLGGVVRRRTSGGRIRLVGESSEHYWDDIYLIECDDVTLTATPASEANSLESGGVRIDGRDEGWQTQSAAGVPMNVILQAQQGWLRFGWRPRHDAAQLVAFDEAGDEAVIMLARFDATHYFDVMATATNTVRLRFNDGGGVHNVNWDCTGLVVADTLYAMEVKYTPSRMELYQDSVVRATITTPINFANIPSTAYWGSTNVPSLEGDSVFSAP